MFAGEYYSDYAKYPEVNKYRLRKVLRDAGDDPIPVYQSRFVPSDDDGRFYVLYINMSMYNKMLYYLCIGLFAC